MRIALIGDLQYSCAQSEDIPEKMEQIRDISPDFAVVMGDFGGPCMRSAQGFADTRELVSLVGCPWHVIFGNHDVEYSPGNSGTFDPTATYEDIFGGTPYRSFVFDGVLVICISVERQPEEGMRTVHAVYVSDSQFEWIKTQLDEHMGMPTVIISHAPIAGSGFRCSRPMHTSSMDTYLDQSFAPERWPQLVADYPQIKAWCSAHFHLGHDYETAITLVNGVVHISSGVFNSCSRDGYLHTRILDIVDGKLEALTFDHTENTLRRDAVVDLMGDSKPEGNVFPANKGEIYLGDDVPEKVWYCGAADRYYVSTKNGLLWEYVTKINDFSGAICLNARVDDLYESDGRLCIACPEEIFTVDLNSKGRFEIFGGFTWRESEQASAPIGNKLPTVAFETRSIKDGLLLKLF